MKRNVVHIMFVLAVLLACALGADACPACKDSFGAGQNEAVGEAYSWSILFMLGVPLTIVSVATVAIVRRVRKHPNSIAE